MKKIILSAAFLIASYFSGFSQFSEAGYKDLKLGTSYSVFNKKYAVELNEYNQGTITKDGIELILKFEDTYDEKSDDTFLILYSITAKDKKATVEGFTKNLIGLSREEMLKTLGDKVEAFEELDEASSHYYLYYVNTANKDNSESACVIYVNDNGKVESISAAYKP